MTLISYADLAAMRLRDYVGEEADIEVEKSGMIGLVGLGGWERLGETYFTWKQGEPFQTAGIDLDLSRASTLPRPTADQILEELGLPVRAGASASELLSVFGQPLDDKPGRLGVRLLRFVCGEGELFLIGCVVDDGDGLQSLFIARMDYCDEDGSI